MRSKFYKVHLKKIICQTIPVLQNDIGIFADYGMLFTVPTLNHEQGDFKMII